MNPLDKRLVPQLDGDHVQFVIDQDSADGIRLAAVTSDKGKQVISGGFEDKSSAKPEQAIDKVPVLDTFEDRRDNRPGVRLIPIRVVKYGEHAYKVIPQRKLSPGEYVVNTAAGEFLFIIR